MHFYRIILQASCLLIGGVFLAGCNPATIGWSSAQGGSISSTRLIAAKRSCEYSKARRKAVSLLDAPGDKQKNERRAIRLLNGTDQCMKKYGMSYRSNNAFGIGRLRAH